MLQLKHMTIYTDAGTKRNGQKGKQETIIVVADNQGKVLFEKQIGDYTNNEGEILAIIAALKNVYPMQSIKIKSDSQIAVNWTKRGKNKKKSKRLTGRHFSFINTAHTLLYLSNSDIEWIPREQNLAGHYIENKFKL